MTATVIRIAGNNAVDGEARAGGLLRFAHRATSFMSPRNLSSPSSAHQCGRTTRSSLLPSLEEARHAGAWLDFGDQREVTMKVGLSFVSAGNAAANLSLEIPGSDFEKVRATAQQDVDRAAESR